jgi:hypothetical protein
VGAGSNDRERDGQQQATPEVPKHAQLLFDSSGEWPAEARS